METIFKQMMMITYLLLLKMLSLLAAPLQFPLLQPLPGTWQQQQLAVQEQMMAIQQFQALQQLNSVPSPMIMNPNQPLLVLLPNAPMKTKDNQYSKENLSYTTKRKPTKETEDEDSDSIIIESDDNIDEATNNENKEPAMRAILLVPNRARLSIGGFISSIPWLPIEINVPDSISWIYEGISGIISGIGQSWPFNRPQASENQSENANMKFGSSDLNTNKIMPIVVMPLAQSVLPMQF